MGIKYIEKVPISKWEYIVRKSEGSYFFHSPAWAKILEKTYDYRIATRLYEINGNEVLIPMMERNKYGFFSYYYSMPLGYGGIFSVSNTSSEVLHEILKTIVSGRNLLFELSLPPYSNFLIQEDFSIKQVNSEWNYTHLLSLEKGFEYLWKEKFDKKIRTAVRKAEKSNIEILTRNSIHDFRKYYELYVESSKRWGYNKPPYCLEFYENMSKFGLHNVQLRLAIKDNNVIAGIINLYYNTNVFYWGSAMLKDYKIYNPINLLLNDSIEQACNKGYKYYNFGASGKLDGTRKFKEGFGAESVETKRYKISSRLRNIALSVLGKVR